MATDQGIRAAEGCRVRDPQIHGGPKPEGASPESFECQLLSPLPGALSCFLNSQGGAQLFCKGAFSRFVFVSCARSFPRSSPFPSSLLSEAELCPPLPTSHPGTRKSWSLGSLLLRG